MAHARPRRLLSDTLDDVSRNDQDPALFARVLALGSGLVFGVVFAVIVTLLSNNSIPLFWACAVCGAIGVVLGALFPRAISAVCFW